MLGSIALTWDANHGTPLRAAVYASATAGPVLELDLGNVVYGPVAPSDLQATFPTSATVVDLGSVEHLTTTHGPSASGLGAVAAAAVFSVVSPDRLAGLARSDFSLRDGTVIARYGNGVDTVVLIERKTVPESGRGFLDNLPTVTVGGRTAHELRTALGTALIWNTGGVTYVLTGSLPPAALESALPAVG